MRGVVSYENIRYEMSVLQRRAQRRQHQAPCQAKREMETWKDGLLTFTQHTPPTEGMPRWGLGLSHQRKPALKHQNQSQNSPKTREKNAAHTSDHPSRPLEQTKGTSKQLENKQNKNKCKALQAVRTSEQPVASWTAAMTSLLYRSTHAAPLCTTTVPPSTSATTPDSPSPSLFTSLRAGVCFGRS